MARSILSAKVAPSACRQSYPFAQGAPSAEARRIASSSEPGASRRAEGCAGSIWKKGSVVKALRISGACAFARASARQSKETKVTVF